jgi:hypothetical protein
MLISLTLLVLGSGTALAHDDMQPASDLEKLVAGIGIVLILSSVFVARKWKRPEIYLDSLSDDSPEQNAR